MSKELMIDCPKRTDYNGFSKEPEDIGSCCKECDGTGYVWVIETDATPELVEFLHGIKL